jgi:signal transduction histidine kinase
MNILSFFLSILNILLNTTYCLLLNYIPLRKFLRVKPITAILLNAFLLALIAVILFIFPEIAGDSGKGQMFGFALYFLIFVPLSLYLLKGCFFQNLFMIVFSPHILGFGNWFEFRFGDVFFPDVHQEVALISKLIIYPLFIVICSHILGRLFKAWNNEAHTQSFWKVLWLIPATLGSLTAISGTVDRLTPDNSLSFLLTRFFSLIALFVCIIMMTDIMNIERETASARMRADTMKTVGDAFLKSHANTEKSLEYMYYTRSETADTIGKIITLSKAGKHDEITALLRDKTALLDSFSTERFCDNEAVNALITYYSNIARSEGIEVTYKLQMPSQAGRIANVDLSRIIGNMLENAIEACRLMEYGAKKIRLQSMISGDMLVIGMNNSFDGDIKDDTDGDFFSRKRESGIATGLKSIRSVAEKYNGSVKFEANDRIFKTSVRLDMAELSDLQNIKI